jgi:hypothetical protein
VITREQLLALGHGPQASKHGVRTGRLYPKGRGVHAVGRAELEPEHVRATIAAVADRLRR